MPSSLMELTIPNILLAARRHEVAELKRLSRKAQLVGAIGHLIHALQLERGASSIYLASAGQRFADTRLDLIADSRQIAQNLSTAFERQLAAGTFEEARQFYLMARCSQRIEAAEEELQDATGLFASLLSHPPASTCLVDRFFDPDMNIDVALKIQPGEVGAGLGDSMVEVLLAQSARLADVERELAQARRVLDERKVVEKAKGLLMTRRGLSEDAAYKLLRQTAMEQNRRMVDLAAAMLSFEDWVSGLAVGTSTDPQDD